MIMQGMTNAEAVQVIAIMFGIGTVTILLLVLGAVFWPETQHGAATVAAWVSHRDSDGRLQHELGSYAYREPADPSYVDELIRVRASFPVVHHPDPLPDDEVLRYVVPAIHRPDPQPVDSPYRTTLAELVASVRAAPANAPTSPARHYSPTIDTAARHSEVVGRHRAPALVAA
jgi:hypothetical protein